MTVIDLFLSCRTAFWFPCFGRMSQVWTGNGLFVVSVRALVRKTHIVVMVNILSCKLFTCTYMADWLTGWVTVITIAFSSSSPVFHFNFFWWFKTAGLLPCIIYVVCLCLLQSHQSREKGCGCSSHWEREIRGRILDSSFGYIKYLLTPAHKYEYFLHDAKQLFECVHFMGEGATA